MKRRLLRLPPNGDPVFCDHRIRFEGFRQAARALRRRRKRKDEKAAAAPYRCKICQGWHIGTEALTKTVQKETNR